MLLQFNIQAIILVATAGLRRSGRKNKVSVEAILLPLLGFLALIALWWVVATFFTTLLPTPWQAFGDNLDYILNPFYRRGPGDLGIGWLLLASLRRVFLGFILGSLVAIPIGFWIGTSRRAMMAINPIVQILRPVSPVAWLPIALAVFNLANPSAIFVIFITSLWPTVINTAVGVSSVSKDYLDVAQILEMPRWRQIYKIILPATLPYIFTGLRLSLGIAWLVIVAVEMLTGGIGIGFFVWDEWNRLSLSSVFLAVVVIGLTGLVLDFVLTKIQQIVTHRPVQQS